MLFSSIFKKWKLYFSYIIPTIIIMCINGSYNIVDSIFIGQSLCFKGLIAFSAIAPVIMLINIGISTLLNSGTAVKISQSIGNGNIKNANQYFGTMIFLNIVVCLLVSSVTFFSLGAVLPLFHLQAEELAYAQQYLSVIILGSVITVLSSSMALTLKNYNHPIFSMFLILLSFWLNVVLDYFMVPTMGMFGAAISTIISQAFLLILDICVFYYILKFQYCLKKNNIMPNFNKIKDIILTGLPSLGQPLSIFLVLFFHNLILSNCYNSSLLSAYACISGIISIGIMLISGVAHGLRPLLARAFGHKDKEQLLNILKFGVLTQLIFGLFIIILIAEFSNVIPILFGLPEYIINVATSGLLLSSLTFLHIGIVKLFYVYFQSIDKIKVAVLISYLGPLVILPICLTLLYLGFGLNGIWISMPVMYTLILFIICGVLLNNKRKQQSYF